MEIFGSYKPLRKLLSLSLVEGKGDFMERVLFSVTPVFLSLTLPLPGYVN